MSFFVETGDSFGLLSLNGAGKTTLIKMLTTLLPPSSGSATIVGFDIVRDASRVRRVIGTISRLLVPLDGSARAGAALPLAQDLALTSGATVVLMRTVDSVAQVLAMATPAGYELDPQLTVEAAEQSVAAQHQAAEAELEPAAGRLRRAGVTCVECEVAEGVPGDTIVDAADRRGSDFIVLATRGRGGVGRALLGSVADYVIRHATGSVIVVRRAKANNDRVIRAIRV